MLYWFMGVSTTHAYPATILPQHEGAIIKSEYEDKAVNESNKTYPGHPNIIATHARIVHPFPYPSLLNMAGANKGKPKPASDRKHDVAASAIYNNKSVLEMCYQEKIIDSVAPEAACNVKESMI